MKVVVCFQLRTHDFLGSVLCSKLDCSVKSSYHFIAVVINSQQARTSAVCAAMNFNVLCVRDSLKRHFDCASIEITWFETSGGT